MHHPAVNSKHGHACRVSEASLALCSVSVGVEKWRLRWLGVTGKCVLNVDRCIYGKNNH